MRLPIQFAVLWLLAAPPTALAQESMGTPAAKAAFARGEEAFKAKKYQEAVEAYRAAIEADPAYAAAHAEFIFASRSYLGRDDQDAAIAKLETVYDGWIKANPNVAAYHWAIADINFYKNPARAEESARRAVTLDPKFARAYQSLSLFAEMKGDNAASADYLRKAAEANPEDPQYLFYYARRVAKTDPTEGTRLSLQVVERFPQHERAAQSLYWLAADEERPDAKLQYLERLRKEFPPEKFNWSDSGMSLLYDVFAASDPAKALALAREREAGSRGAGSWKERATLQQNLLEARTLIAAKKGTEAKALLEATKVPRGVSQTPLLLAKAEARAVADGPRAAYDDLAPGVAKQPTDPTRDALLRYGSQLGLSEAQVAADLASRRTAAAKPAPAFVLDGYDGRKLSLADFKGKVVLLNFWYPG